MNEYVKNGTHDYGLFKHKRNHHKTNKIIIKEDQ